jgi:FMN phosphatase YigB (HAD superfamily)
MKLLDGIRNIIFDFGGVIIEIEFDRVRKAFRDLGMDNFDDHFTKFRQSPVFDRFDTGRVSEDEFFSEIEKHLPEGVRREEVIAAWNAMLGHFPEEHFHFLMEMKNRYNTYILSNTNETHLRFYFRKLNEWFGIENMDVFFNKSYYSNVIHLRKPDVKIFEFVCRDAGLNPSETLFIDDTLYHVEGARKVGLRAFHLQKPYSILDLENISGVKPDGSLVSQE